MGKQDSMGEYAGTVAGLKKLSDIVPPVDKGQIQKLGQSLASTLSAYTRGNRKPFSELETVEELRQYLDDTTQRLRSSAYIYHYTTVSNVIKMIRSKLWHFGNAKNMNDKLEYKHGDNQRWMNLFFSCFMCEDRESIGMWSMYAQPWETGVKISIPKDVLRKWLETVKEILEISIDTYRPTGRSIDIEKIHASLRLSSVAYCNTDSLQGNESEEKIVWSNVSNSKLVSFAHAPELTGYIKDVAWSYEKEIRIKAEFENIYGYKRVAIPATDDVINSMIITASPLFDGNLSEDIEREVAYQLRTDKSIFTDRLNIKTICQDCELKKNATHVL